MAFEAFKRTRRLNSSFQYNCISTMNCRPCWSLQRTSTMLSFLAGLSGTISGVRYSTLSICPSSDRGSRAFSRLITKSGCSPKTNLKVKSALGFKYFPLIVTSLFVSLLLFSIIIDSECYKIFGYKDTNNYSE